MYKSHQNSWKLLQKELSVIEEKTQIPKRKTATKFAKTEFAFVLTDSWNIFGFQNP